jgi:phenylacetate-coenzyme A ligase PaaK-like adenylate-forming protein
MGPTERREMQGEKLRGQSRYVPDRSPSYRRKFEDSGFDATRLESLGDLAYAPFTHKDELRESQVEHLLWEGKRRSAERTGRMTSQSEASLRLADQSVDRNCPVG